MCGIVGIWSSGKEISGAILDSMAEALAHRGPDDSGSYIDERSNIGFAHRRLSIVDLSPLGHQPMSNDDGSIWITYNGEVYNFKNIRNELIQKGHRFKSNTDTEVVLKSYEEWGIECVHKFIGMFALGIWDKRSRKLYLLRDRAGVKPLYYYSNNGLFMFGSELKALMQHPEYKKDIDYDSLAVYVRHGYIPAPHTIFQNTYKLKPGHYLCLSDSDNIKEIKYWDVTDYYLQKPLDQSEDEILEELESLLLDSFKYRLVADVPIGVFLSGGIDSTTLCALLQSNVSSQLKTYSIGFYDDSFNEAEWAKKIADYIGTDHTEYYISASEALDIVPKLPEIYDEPFADNSGIPTYLVSKLTRESAKVALSADGGDELFCGYNRYLYSENIYQKHTKMPGLLGDAITNGLDLLSPELVDWTYKKLGFALPHVHDFRHKYIKLRNMISNIHRGDYVEMYKTAIGYWTTEELNNIMLNPGNSPYDSFIADTFSKLQGKGLLTQMMATDFKYYLVDDILTKLDRASMSVSLEGRDPFLDHRLIEYAARIPSNMHYKNGQSKHLLRRILYKYVPKKLLERPKRGFAVPLYSWLREDLAELVRDHLSYEKIDKDGIFNPETISRNVNDFMKGATINANSIWCILMFQMWKEKWMPS